MSQSSVKDFRLCLHETLLSKWKLIIIIIIIRTYFFFEIVS